MCFIGGNGYLSTGELGYDGPQYDILLPMTDDVRSPSPMHIKYVTYMYMPDFAYDGPIFLIQVRLYIRPWFYACFWLIGS